MLAKQHSDVVLSCNKTTATHRLKKVMNVYAASNA